MITKIKPKTTTIGTNRNDFRNAPEDTIQEQQRMPKLSSAKLSVAENNISVPPRTGFSIQIPESVRNEKGIHLQFSIKPVEVVDITIELNKQPEKPIFPDSGVATFKDVVIHNAPVDDTLPAEPIQKPEPLEKIFTDNVLYAKMIDGSEKLIQTPQLFSSEKTQIDIFQVLAITFCTTFYHFAVRFIFAAFLDFTHNKNMLQFYDYKKSGFEKNLLKKNYINF